MTTCDFIDTQTSGHHGAGHLLHRIVCAFLNLTVHGHQNFAFKTPVRHSQRQSSRPELLKARSNIKYPSLKLSPTLIHVHTEVSARSGRGPNRRTYTCYSPSCSFMITVASNHIQCTKIGGGTEQHERIRRRLRCKRCMSLSY